MAGKATGRQGNTIKSQTGVGASRLMDFKQGL